MMSAEPNAIEHRVAMSLRSIRAGIEDLADVARHISESDQAELAMARFELEQLLELVLQREAVE
jgi:hypothetical protein